MNSYGPMLWRFMHSYSLNYPTRPTENDRLRAIKYFTTIPKYIPCPRCAAHFQEILNNNPPVVDSRASLAEWVFDVHNIVNANIGKPIFTTEEFMRKYSPQVFKDQPLPDIGTRITGALISGLFHTFN